MRTAFLAWGRLWRPKDFVLLLVGSVLMVAGMALLARSGALILLPLFVGILIFMMTPLGKIPRSQRARIRD